MGDIWEDYRDFFIFVIVIFFLFGGLGIYGKFVGGWFDNYYEETVGKERIRIETKNFKESNAFIESKVTAAARYFDEYRQAESASDSTTIVNIVRSEFQSFDTQHIENQLVKKFIDDCLNYQN